VAARRAEPGGQEPGAAAPAHDDDGRIVRLRSQDGLILAARIFDPPGSPRLPLLCLPGLSRNSRDFARLGRYFSRHPAEPRKVVALDYRGRGLSDADPSWRNYTPLVEAHDALAAAASLGIERAVVVGTSRGGIIAMLLGALRPTVLAGVVLNDIGPVVEGTGLARIKTYLANRQPARTPQEAEALVRQIAGTHFPALQDEDWRAFTAAYFVETSRGLIPQFDPNLLRTLDGIDFAEKIPALWPQFTSLTRVPVLAVRGEHSDILSPGTLAAMAERHPDFEHLTVSGQGHPPLLRDEPTLERIRAFAAGCDGAALS
jgi:pimeloyl-ACP methyl ester carboxylesterase